MADIIPLDLVDDDTGVGYTQPSVIPLSDVEDDTVVTRQPTWGESARYVGKSILEGGTNLLKLGLDYNPVNPQALYLPKEQRASSAIDGLISSLGLSPDTENIQGVEPIRAGLNAVGAPLPGGGAVANFASGAGAKLAEQLFPDSWVAPIVGGVAGAGAVGAANKVANTVKSAGQAFERSSIGAAAKDYVKSQKIAGLFTDEEAGEVGTQLSKAIENIAERDGLGLNRSPEALALRIRGQLSQTGEEIGNTLALADEVGVSPKVNFFDEGSAVKDLIDKAKATKGQIKSAFNEFLDNFTHPENGWDGSISSLNNWKTDIADMAYSGSASGNLAPAVSRKLNRAIASDIRKAVNSAVVDSGVAKADDWAALMAKNADYQTVAPIVAESAARGLGSTWDKAARALLRTSGGTLTTPTLIGGALTAGAAGPVAGLTAGAGLAALGTPTGQGITGNVLKALGNIGGRATEGGMVQSAISGLISSLYGNDAESQVETPTTGESPVPNDNMDVSTLLQSIYGDTDVTPKNLSPKKQEIADLIDSQAINSPLFKRVVQAESSFNPNATGPTTKYGTAKGLAQLLDSTGKEWHKKLGLSGEYDPYNPEQAIKIGSAYLNWLNEQFDGDERLALAGYNYGIGNVKKLISKYGNSFADIAPYLPQETANYVNKISGVTEV